MYNYIYIIFTIAYQTQTQKPQAPLTLLSLLVLARVKKMSLLTDLLNLNLPDITDKIIAEYIWSASIISVCLC